MEPRQWEVQGEVMLPGSGSPSAAVEAPYNFSRTSGWASSVGLTPLPFPAALAAFTAVAALAQTARCPVAHFQHGRPGAFDSRVHASAAAQLPASHLAELRPHLPRPAPAPAA